MTRLLAHLRLLLAIAVVGVATCALCGATATAVSAISPVGTPLPAGWELCILQGLAAPATAANVADLDEWQAAEGGSTNNTASYNPFNTGRTTDANGTPLPEVTSANGFPAFADWLSGCAATVGTLVQPNMWSITAALRTGNVSPPPAFLATVDQSQWCAPSADGTPCYEDTILGAAGSIAASVLNQSSALEVYGNVKSDVHDYQQAVATVVADQGLLTARQQQLVQAQVAVSRAQQHFASAQHELQSIAVDEYVSNGLYEAGSYVSPSTGSAPFGSPSAEGVVAQQYQRIVAADLVARFQSAESAVNASLAQRDEAARAVAQATSTLTSDNAAEDRSLTKLVADVATMQKAGACTTVTVATTTPGSSAPATSSNSPATTNSTTTTTAPAHAPTTVPTSAVTSTVPSTTTTVAPTTTTTTHANPSIAVQTSSTTTTTTSTTTTTTTSTSTTTTTIAPPSTTTTTSPGGTPASSGTSGSPSANPAGISALQGCMAAFAPPASA